MKFVKTVFNEETKKHEWVLNKWHQKTAMVIGYAVSAIYIFAFVVGFVIGVSNSI